MIFKILNLKEILNVYLTLLGNLRLWSVISNESSLGQIGHDEKGRIKTKVERYKLIHSRSIYLFRFMYIFRSG